MTMTSSTAAELLRGYAPAGTPLAICRAAAEDATYTDPERRHRVKEAIRTLGLDRP